MATPPGFSPPARALVTAAALVILAVGVQLASPVLAPILLAVFIAVVATPPLRWLRQHGWQSGWPCSWWSSCCSISVASWP